MASNKQKQHDELESVQEALSRSEAFIENNRKHLLYGIGAIVAVVLVFISINNFYIAPQESEAANRIIPAIEYFERDSFALALNGDGANEGFIEIMDSYSVTGTADLAAFYAGVCSYKLGNFEEAVEYLNKFDADAVNATPVAIGLAGDCYSSLAEYEKAAKYYAKAAAFDNEFTAPVYLKKLGIVFEELGKYAQAEEAYQTIKDKYFASQIAMDIEKYIERAKSKK